MLDKKAEAMLQAANALTADDLDCLSSTAAVATIEPPDEETEEAAPTAQEDTGATGADEDIESDDGAAPPQIPSPPQPAIPLSRPDCPDADLDKDRDVDQADFGVFQRCYSGSNTLPEPGCAKQFLE